MEIINQELINKSLDFLKNISKNDKVCVIHHTDPDGVSSGVLMCKLIERLRGKFVDLRHNQPGAVHGFTNETLKILKAKRINKVITTDISAEENYENWKKIEKFAKILIVDHHPTLYEETGDTIIIKPQLFVKGITPVKYCAAKLVYDIASRLIDFSDLDWIASIGVISDIATEPWKEFLEQVFKKYNFEKGKDWFDSPLGKAASVISSTECYDESFVYKSFDVVYNAKSPEEIINSELKKYRKIIEKEVNYWISNVNKLAEKYPEIDAIYYEIKPEHKVKSSVCTILGLNMPDKTIFVVDAEGKNVSISARRGDCKKDVGTILRTIAKEIEGAHAGGHIPSAGAVVPKKHYAEFKRRLMEYLRANN